MKTLKYSLLLVLFLLPATIFSQNRMAQAMDAIKKSNFDLALIIAKEFLDKDSTQAALRILINAEERYLDSRQLFELIGDAYRKTGVVELALLNYEKAEARDSLDLDLKFKIADYLFKQRRYTDAANKYLKIISMDSTNTKAYYEVGNIFYLAEMYADAGAIFEKYLSFTSDQDIYQKAAKSFTEAKNWQKVYDISSSGLLKFPDDVLLQKHKGTSAYWLRKFDESIEVYSSLPDTMMTIVDLVRGGKAAEITKRDSVALVFYYRAFERDTTLKELYLDMARLNYGLKNFMEAARFYRKKTEYDPTFEPAWRFLAFSYLNMQDFENTKNSLLRAIALNDTIVDSFFWLANSYKGVDSAAKAMDIYVQMLKMIEGREERFKMQATEANRALGQWHFERKNFGLAIPFLRKAVELSPNDVNSNLFLASAYHSNGNLDEAIRFYRRILQLDRNNDAAKKGLRLLSAD
ncbi:MAG: hypothetical protein C0425_06335 [Chlorobiaceae bacterium]|nr:hypothetical protein [Chlorobiaceae bacterium]MBA4309938.1 hypothetical protein [Chlorobiaceae bacterium]